jgi:phosphoglycerol transferase MdoB-like AlkP superfamily enzyme
MKTWGPLSFFITLFYSFILILSLSTLFRILFFLIGYHGVPIIPGTSVLVARSFLIGLRFDVLIACYSLIIPWLLLSVALFHAKWLLWIRYLIFGWLSLFLAFACLAFSADIPYFRHFNCRISIAILNWMDTPGFVFRMIFEEPGFYLFFLIFLAVLIPSIWLLYRIVVSRLSNISLQPHQPWRLMQSILIALLTGGLMFVGIRGRLVAKSPLKPAAAYFCDIPFLNQMALNPVYTFSVSYSDSRKPLHQQLQLLPADEALVQTRRLLHISDSNECSPVAREIIPEGAPKLLNVVIILMESMTAEYMAAFGNQDSLTPCLDSIAKESWFFKNFYSTGLHTMNGVFSVVCGYPTLLNQQPMNEVIIPKYYGIGTILQEHGYKTLYGTTHDELFDNIGGFLRINGFQRIISEADFPAEEIKSTLGVPDDYLFRYAIPVLTEIHNNGNPFLAVLCTSSLHEPYIIPDYFKPHSENKRNQAVEYSDWAINHFLSQASQHSWYDSTIFVLVSDHGCYVKPYAFDSPLTMHHIPLIIHAPESITPRMFLNFGGQIDILPTIMGLLNINWMNNTLGVDLNKQQRPCMYYCDDNRICCIDSEFIWIYRVSGPEGLYRWTYWNQTNYIDQFPAYAEILRNYAFTQLQTAQWMISNKLTSCGRDTRGKNH